MILDFITKRITLEVDPTEVWDQTQKNHMAEFFNILAEPYYYEEQETAVAKYEEDK